MNHTIKIKQHGEVVLQITIPLAEGVIYTDLEWDSKTGMVSAIVNEERVVLPYTGISCGTIVPGTFEIEGATYDNMNYHYWYY